MFKTREVRNLATGAEPAALTREERIASVALPGKPARPLLANVP